MREERVQILQEIGSAFARTRPAEDMPSRPTLMDMFNLRLNTPKFGLPIAAAQHCTQCAGNALKAGMDEETVLACLLHDIGLAVVRPDHGWWGAQLVEPYVSEKVSWAIRYHQALRFYPDLSVGFEYPKMYVTMFGENYKPPAYIAAAHEYARNHKWYMASRMITLYDDYSFEKNPQWSIEPFIDIIGRHFRQPKEGLGNDASPTAHMWRTLIDPGKPL
jgi:HD domain